LGLWIDPARLGYQSVSRFVRNLHGAAAPEVRAIIETKLGEEAQVQAATQQLMYLLPVLLPQFNLKPHASAQDVDADPAGSPSKWQV